MEKWEVTLTEEQLCVKGLENIGFYIRDLTDSLEKTFEKDEKLEYACDEVCHSRGVSWLMCLWRDGSYEHTPEAYEGLGYRLFQMGQCVTWTAVDEDQKEDFTEYGVTTGSPDDVGFYLTEIGEGLMSMAALWNKSKDLLSNYVGKGFLN